MPKAKKTDNTTVSRRRFCAAASAVVAGAGTAASAAIAAPVANTTDARTDENQALLAAGAEFERLLQIERALWNAIPDDAPDSSWAPAEAANRETAKVVETIVSLRASTTVGYKIKARAAAWCHSSFDGPVNIAHAASGTDVRLASSIVQDLLQNWEPANWPDPEKPSSYRFFPIHPEDRKMLKRDFEVAIVDMKKPIRNGCLVIVSCSAETPFGADPKDYRLARVLNADRDGHILLAGMNGRPIDGVPSFGMCRVTGLQSSDV